MPEIEQAEAETLRDEIRSLREEVRNLREVLAVPQVHHHYAPWPSVPPPWQPNVTYYPWQTYGAAPVPQTYVVNTTACADSVTILAPTAGCAGPPPALTTLVNFS